MKIEETNAKIFFVILFNQETNLLQLIALNRKINWGHFFHGVNFGRFEYKNYSHEAASCVHAAWLPLNFAGLLL